MENSYRDIIVIGMHRSGTSAVSNFLNKLGVGVGDSSSLLETASDNERGFFERLDIISVNDLILRENNSEWDAPDTSSLSQLSTKPVTASVGKEIEGIVLSYHDKKSAGFAKDPRFCLTLPVWQNYLKKPVYVVCLRNPLEVARSLQKRNGFSVFKGLGLWEIYLWSLFSCVELADCVFVNFNAFTSNPEEVGESISRQLSACGVLLSQPWQQAVEASFDASLKHEQFSQAELEQLLSVRQFSLWNLIQQQDFTALASACRAMTFAEKNAHLVQRNTDVGYAVNELEVKVYTDQNRKRCHTYTRLVDEKTEWILNLPKEQRALSAIKVKVLNKPCVVRKISISFGTGDRTISVTQFVHNGYHDPITGWYYFGDNEPCILLDNVDDHIEHIVVAVEYVSLYEGETDVLLREAFAHLARQDKDVCPVWNESSSGQSGRNQQTQSCIFSLRTAKEDIGALFQALQCGLGIRNLFAFMKNYKLLRNHPCYFSYEFYRNTYPDVTRAGLNPLVHFLLTGWKERRNPSGNFDMQFYLENNNDVEALGINPLLHFIETGWREGRDPSRDFDCTRYLVEHPQAKQEDVDPLVYLFNR